MAATENKKIKILVCCGINGRINPFIEYIEALFVKKGLFDYVFCVGDFFGDDESSEKEWEEFKASGKKISVPIYTLGPNKKEHEKYFENLQDQQLASNIFYLGKDGIFNTADGLKIGYISGIQKDDDKENEMHTFNYDSISQFKESCIRAGCVSLDLLLTSPWPLDVRNKERIPENQNIKGLIDKVTESSLLSWVAINLTPRYHFAGMQKVFYQRSPYKNCNSNIITRFIGLGDYHNKTSKEKWIYGFVLSPLELISNKINYTVTESPYSSNISQYTANLLPASKQYFYNTSTNGNFSKDEPTKKRKFGGQAVKQSIDVNTESCWFCLSSKNITKHMVISIGEQIYLAGTKGPLVKEHVLIAPIEHYKSFAEIPPETENEINLIKSCLNKYFESTGRVAIYFERNILSAHFQLQVIPIPMRMIERIEPMFKLKFKQYDLNLVDLPPAASLRQIAMNTEHYFCVELPNGKSLFHNASKKSSGYQPRFPIHIAREVLAAPSLLNVQDRIDWRKCQQTLDEEETDMKFFRRAFAPYNAIKD